MSGNLYESLAGGFPSDRSRPCFQLSDGRAVSYAELEDGVAHVAGRLRARGVQPGDRVALKAEKSVEAVMIYLGALKAGAVFLPLNVAYTRSETDYFLSDAEPAIVITDAEGFLAEAREAPRLDACVSRSGDDLASIIYTSGTTGRSKGAMLHHGALAANARTLTRLWAFTPDDTLLHALPIFHVHGLFVALHCVFLSGASMIWLPKFNDDEVLAGFFPTRCLGVCLSPFMPPRLPQRTGNEALGTRIHPSLFVFSFIQSCNRDRDMDGQKGRLGI